MKKSSKKNSFLINLIVVLFTILMIFLIYYKITNDKNKTVDVYQEMFDKVDKNESVKVSKYIVYGTHFNIEGSISIPKITEISVDKSDLIIKSLKGDQVVFESNSSYLDGILSFSSINELNSGLNLESLETGDYYLFLRVTFSNGDTKYYSFINDTKYENINYYTITKENKNNKVVIDFDKYNDIPCMKINVKQTNELPEDVYDIVIDPGHGGADDGFKNGTNKESDIVLNCAKKLKSQLEEKGLKVLLTRNGTETSSEFNDLTIYNENGRVTIANKSHAKILISLHLDGTKSISGGVQVNAPSNCKLDLAKSIADNIVKYTNTSYSKANSNKRDEGVYVHSFNNAEILLFKQSAKSKGFEPYDITTNTPFLYMIREIGGICTNAFVDGRNTSYAANEYYDSNIGIEGYIIDLGYINVQKDLKNILNNKDSYMQAICNSISNFYGIEN